MATSVARASGARAWPITSSSPLQYQKGLRRLEARRLLAAGSGSVTTVPFDVGYESPSQFSREYTRQFGRPPSHDAAKPARLELPAPERRVRGEQPAIIPSPR